MTAQQMADVLRGVRIETRAGVLIAGPELGVEWIDALATAAHEVVATRDHQIRLLAAAIVKIAQAAGATGVRALTGPEVLDLAEQTADEVQTLRGRLAEAWDEAAEATAEWIANNPGPSGIPHDPPTNPYGGAR